MLKFELNDLKHVLEEVNSEIELSLVMTSCYEVNIWGLQFFRN
jgi:hypothetical protein